LEKPRLLAKILVIRQGLDRAIIGKGAEGYAKKKRRKFIFAAGEEARGEGAEGAGGCLAIERARQ